jgi:Na+-translocating ferredoxin:NAD+ oxidoreductase RNF subunit RnfB
MAFVIAEACIGTKDTASVDACAVDCIHPKKNTTTTTVLASMRSRSSTSIP